MSSRPDGGSAVDGGLIIAISILMYVLFVGGIVALKDTLVQKDGAFSVAFTKWGRLALLLTSAAFVAFTVAIPEWTADGLTPFSTFVGGFDTCTCGGAALSCGDGDSSNSKIRAVQACSLFGMFCHVGVVVLSFFAARRSIVAAEAQADDQELAATTAAPSAVVATSPVTSSSSEPSAAAAPVPVPAADSQMMTRKKKPSAVVEPQAEAQAPATAQAGDPDDGRNSPSSPTPPFSPANESPKSPPSQSNKKKGGNKKKGAETTSDASPRELSATTPASVEGTSATTAVNAPSAAAEEDSDDRRSNKSTSSSTRDDQAATDPNQIPFIFRLGPFLLLVATVFFYFLTIVIMPSVSCGVNAELGWGWVFRFFEFLILLITAGIYAYLRFIKGGDEHQPTEGADDDEQPSSAPGTAAPASTGAGNEEADAAETPPAVGNPARDNAFLHIVMLIMLGSVALSTTSREWQTGAAPVVAAPNGTSGGIGSNISSADSVASYYGSSSAAAAAAPIAPFSFAGAGDNSSNSTTNMTDNTTGNTTTTTTMENMTTTTVDDNSNNTASANSTTTVAAPVSPPPPTTTTAAAMTTTTVLNSSSDLPAVMVPFAEYRAFWQETQTVGVFFGPCFCAHTACSADRPARDAQLSFYIFFVLIFFCALLLELVSNCSVWNFLVMRSLFDAEGEKQLMTSKGVLAARMGFALLVPLFMLLTVVIAAGRLAVGECGMGMQRARFGLVANIFVMIFVVFEGHISFFMFRRDYKEFYPPAANDEEDGEEDEEGQDANDDIDAETGEKKTKPKTKKKTSKKNGAAESQDDRVNTSAVIENSPHSAAAAAAAADGENFDDVVMRPPSADDEATAAAAAAVAAPVPALVEPPGPRPKPDAAAEDNKVAAAAAAAAGSANDSDSAAVAEPEPESAPAAAFTPAEQPDPSPAPPPPGKEASTPVAAEPMAAEKPKRKEKKKPKQQEEEEVVVSDPSPPASPASADDGDDGGQDVPQGEKLEEEDLDF